MAGLEAIDFFLVDALPPVIAIGVVHTFFIEVSGDNGRRQEPGIL